MDFLTFKAKNTFIYLQKAFTKALILNYFDPKFHIQIKIDASRYTIGKVINQLTSKTGLVSQVKHKSNNQPNSLSEIGWWHLIAFFS